MPADFSEDPISSKALVSITAYKDSLDLSISIKFRVEVSAREPMLDSIAKEPMLDSVAKDPMLDRAAYQDVWLDTGHFSEAEICSNPFEVFFKCLGFPQPISSPPNLLKFPVWGPRSGETDLSLCYQH